MLKRNKKSNHFIAGGFAATMKTVIGQPFDVLSTSMIGKEKGIGMNGVVRRIWMKEGIRGMWKGVIPSLYRLLPHAATYYYCLNAFTMICDKNMIDFGNKNIMNFVIGGSARTVAAIVTCPLLVVKTHFEYNAIHENKSLYNSISGIFQKYGFRGLYRGLSSSIIRNAPYGGVFFSIYSFLNKNNDSYYRILLSSGVASTSAHLILHPFDVIRTRIQLNYDKQIGIMNGMKDIYHKESIFGLWRGTFPKIMKKGVASSVAWTFYNFILSKKSDKTIIK